MIVAEAIRFFAEFGFAAPTRALASRLGITQPLLYRYFPTKEHLIQRLYDELVVDRWRPEWEELIRDRSIALTERLAALYTASTASLFTYERMRVFFFMWLAGDKLRDRFLSTPNRAQFRLIAGEIRHAFGLPGPEELPVTAAEEEIVWGLQGGIIYLGIREYIFGLTLAEDRETLIRWQVETFARGVEPLVRRVLGLAAAGSELPDRRAPHDMPAGTLRDTLGRRGRQRA